MLQNAYLLSKIGADTAENERHFAEKYRSGNGLGNQFRWLRYGIDILDRYGRLLAYVFCNIFIILSFG